MSVHDLREVLRERAEAPSPANPYRHDQVHSRIRRTRLRRRATAGATALAAVVVAVSVVQGVGEPAPRETTAAAWPGSGLPERFSSPDGTEYRRVATATVKPNGAQTSITVPVTGRPLEAAMLCDRQVILPDVLVNGHRISTPGFGCGGDSVSLRPLDVQKDAKEITVTFDTTGSGCVLKAEHGPCVPDKPRTADWELAVYEWTPPARPVFPRPATLPDQVRGWRQAALTTGTLPKNSSLTMEVVGNGGDFSIQQNCTGDLSTRMWFKYWVGGSELPSTMGCGTEPKTRNTFTAAKGEKVTVTVRMGLWGESTNRPVDWAVGLYRE
ncbi:hypothetical protein [Nonomuraea insulae]|uniref:Uncharacterized protein n=1 Tax=Nonomuraea insulae TaxID=1616787 RepID=A0ABW1CY45_9ACTN